jgi:hypothetical protein
VPDAFVPHLEAMGLGMVATGTLSVMQCFPSNLEGIAHSQLRMLDTMVGAYRRRTLEALNPLWWVESIVFLPQRLLMFVGLPGDKALAKFILVLWWIVTTTTGVAWAIFEDEIRESVRQITATEERL